MPSGSFSINAAFVGGRWQHDINNDHFGSLSDLYVAIESPIGPWAEGTPLHYVLEDLFTRIMALGNGTRQVSVLYIDAYIHETLVTQTGSYTQAVFRIDSVKKRNMTGSMTLDAFFELRGSFTADAVIRGSATFTVDAIVV